MIQRIQLPRLLANIQIAEMNQIASPRDVLYFVYDKQIFYEWRGVVFTMIRAVIVQPYLWRHPMKTTTRYTALALGIIATPAMNNVMSELRLNSKERLLWEYKKTAAALQRLESGEEFGLCIDCGIPIEAARLRASPIVTRCVRCQEKREVRQDERDATPSL